MRLQDEPCAEPLHISAKDHSEVDDSQMIANMRRRSGTPQPVPRWPSSTGAAMSMCTHLPAPTTTFSPPDRDRDRQTDRQTESDTDRQTETESLQGLQGCFAHKKRTPPPRSQWRAGPPPRARPCRCAPTCLRPPPPSALQGYLAHKKQLYIPEYFAHKKQPPSWEPPRTLGTGLRKDPPVPRWPSSTGTAMSMCTHLPAIPRGARI